MQLGSRWERNAIISFVQIKMKNFYGLIIVVVVSTSASQGLRQIYPKVTVFPTYSLDQWEEFLDVATQTSELSCEGCLNGTEPQHPLAGKLVKRLIKNGLRIMNGKKATEGQFPWQAAIVMDKNYFCGGSILSEKWILTAGHCVAEYSTFEVTVGSVLWQSGSNRQIRTSNKGILHEAFNLDKIENDIGLVYLSSSVSLGSITGSVSAALYYVEQTLISNQECRRYYGNKVHNYVVCSAGRSTKGTCNGDSGGPLVTEQSDGTFQQVGIVSFGVEHCLNGYPSAYTRTFSFLPWISDKTGLKL